MTPTEYAAALGRLGLTIASKATAATLGCTVRSSQRYASGERPIPRHVALLLAALEAAQESAKKVRERA